MNDKEYIERLIKDLHPGRTKKGDWSLRSREIIVAIEGYTRFTKGNVPQGVLTEIAKEFGVSRERVRQIMVRSGLFTPAHKREPIKSICENCGTTFTSKRRPIKRACSPRRV